MTKVMIIVNALMAHLTLNISSGPDTCWPGYKDGEIEMHIFGGTLLNMYYLTFEDILKVEMLKCNGSSNFRSNR